MFVNIQTTCQDYYSKIPENSLRCVLKSAAYSFCISFYTTNLHKGVIDLSRPMASAAVGALASAIHALTAPFFKWMFDNEVCHPVQELIKFYVDVTFAHCLTSYATANKISLFTILPNRLVISLMSNNILKLPFVLPKWLFEFIDPELERQYSRILNDYLGMDINKATPSIYFTNPFFPI